MHFRLKLNHHDELHASFLMSIIFSRQVTPALNAYVDIGIATFKLLTLILKSDRLKCVEKWLRFRRLNFLKFRRIKCQKLKLFKTPKNWALLFKHFCLECNRLNLRIHFNLNRWNFLLNDIVFFPSENFIILGMSERRYYFTHLSQLFKIFS